MAGELLQLYAARQAIPGFAFRPTASSAPASRPRSPSRRPPTRRRPSTRSRTTWRRRSPWTASICGDVGYGKTEVAMRAAFKAVEDGKQVAVLVPTTILAEQHWMTFQQRFADLPVTVGMVSRFRSGARCARRSAARRGQGRHPDRHAPAASTDMRPRTSASSSSTRSSASACPRRSCCKQLQASRWTC